MRQRVHWIIFPLFLVVYHNNIGLYSVRAKSPYSWIKKDRFDEVNDHISSIDKHNCHSKDKSELTLRKDVVSQLPVYNELLSRVWYRNRSSLIHIHNMALNRAFFYSYVLQKMNDSATFKKQPNWVYFYYSATADVNANPNGINGSAFYFDTHCHYPNWYTTVAFNKTLPLFGPKIWRHDDYNDQSNFLREPTRTVCRGTDYGAGRFMNYTHSKFKMNPWYENWLPDLASNMDSMTKFTYYIGIRESNVTGSFITEDYQSFAFFGPNSPSARDTDERLLPVQFTAPYFDCGGSNKWVVSAVSPVVDFMPRYTNWTRLRRQRIVGVSSMDIDFMEVDFNACGISDGNPGPSYLSGIARCPPRTGCKHKAGMGFRRGGYNCNCGRGWRWPMYSSRPYSGPRIEQSVKEEWDYGFECLASNYQLVLPKVDTKTVNVEGAEVLTNSGGLTSDDLGDASGRRRREAMTNGTSGMKHNKYVMRAQSVIDTVVHMTTSGKDDNDGEPLQETREPSVQEMIMLADRLREMRESNRLRKYLKHQGPGYTLDQDAMSREDDYADRNNVDYTVEREYESDLKQHENYRDFLIEADKATGRRNKSRVQNAMENDVLQLRERHQQRFHANRLKAGALRRKKRASVFSDLAFDRMMQIFRWRASVTAANCHTAPTHRLILPGGVGYGADKQFENEGRTAMRLTHFLSMYLQNVMPNENFGNLLGGGPLHSDMMFGEVIANVMGNYRISAAGVFFDRYKWRNDDESARELFGPWAYRKSGGFYAIDQAGLSSQYTDTDWFRQAKARHGANFQHVKRYSLQAYVRSDPNGTSSIRHEYYPMIYYAATYEVGFWTRPYFKCDGNVDDWVMTYVSPFFGLDSLRTKLEFRGVATVDVPIRFIEINQCPMPFYVANAFKNTARCDYLSTNCRPLAGFPFLRGSYRCNCRLGFEYWHADGKTWIEGSLVELEYEKKQLGLFSRFDHLNCRPSRASHSLPTSPLAVFTALVLFVIYAS